MIDPEGSRLKRMDARAAIGEGGCTREYLSDVLDVCRCPSCRNSLRWREGSEAVGPAQTPSLECEGCGNAYPFRDGIIEFIPPDVSLEPTAESVRRFYDEFGWQVDPTSGRYNDSALFAGDSASSRYYEIYSHLSFLENFGGGKFILDAACGPIAHQEYLAYSLGYKYRVCADISLTALKEARRRVGANGIYCLCSLVSLPFAPDAFGAVISGYTVQHIRDDDQRKAIFELVRVLSPGGTLSIMTAVDSAFQRLLGRTRRVVKRFLPRRRQEGDALLATNDRSPNLYFRPPRARWWRGTAESIGCRDLSVRVSCLRLFDAADFQRLIGRRVSTAKKLRAVETLFSHLLLPFAACILVEIRKRSST